MPAPTGDVNADHRFDQLDLVQVLQSGKYGTELAATWTEGDWNGDGFFSHADILAVLQEGTYGQG